MTADARAKPLPSPYVGVTGFTARQEVRQIVDDGSFTAFTRDGGHRLAVGVLASWKSLHGEPVGNWQGRYPAVGDIRGILEAAAESEATRMGCLRFIHYTTREPGLAAQLDRLVELAGPTLDGFQLNIAWPEPAEVTAFQRRHPNLELILQVNRSLYVQKHGQDARRLAGAIQRSFGQCLPQRLLFDMSGGKGVQLDATEAEGTVEILHRLLGERMTMGVAGGLSEGNLDLLAPLLRRWPNLSFDAEGRIREDADTLGRRALDYVRASAKLITA